MSDKQLQMDQQSLIEAWNEELPEFLNDGDSSEVTGDVDPTSIRIRIHVAGRTKYELDFVCTYLDSREVDVDLVDVDQDNRSVDEHTDIIQNMVEDYVRCIHECAQSLKKLTTANT